MRTVIRIEEENHGFIGLVQDDTDIIPFLVDNDWINEQSTVCVLDDKNDWCSILLKNLFGEEWFDALSLMPVSILRTFFDETFCFYYETVYEASSEF